MADELLLPLWQKDFQNQKPSRSISILHWFTCDWNGGEGRTDEFSHFDTSTAFSSSSPRKWQLVGITKLFFRLKLNSSTSFHTTLTQQFEWTKSVRLRFQSCLRWLIRDGSIDWSFQFNTRVLIMWCWSWPPLLFIVTCTPNLLVFCSTPTVTSRNMIEKSYPQLSPDQTRSQAVGLSPEREITGSRLTSQTQRASATVEAYQIFRNVSSHTAPEKTTDETSCIRGLQSASGCEPSPSRGRCSNRRL
jgi:hypothetical protein